MCVQVRILIKLEPWETSGQKNDAKQGDAKRFFVNPFQKLAELTSRARDAINADDWEEFAQLMSTNFNTRRQIYGDECLGQRNIRMVEIGQEFGASCKFPGKNIFVEIAI